MATSYECSTGSQTVIRSYLKPLAMEAEELDGIDDSELGA